MTYDANGLDTDSAQTLTNKTISGASNTITNLALTSAVTGILPVANGGTNASSASAARTSLGAANIAGDTFTGKIQFSGTGHAGIKLNSLTSTERDALTAATGDLIYNVTTSSVQRYNGSSWDSLSTGGGSGDVVGPGSATDNAIARFDSTTGKLIQNSGITIADGATGSLSGTNTGDQNLFQTIAVSGQSDVVADSATDTLTLVAGTNVTITTNASTDTITISASGGGGTTSMARTFLLMGG